MSNLSIANVFLFVTILCLALSAQLGDVRNAVFSVAGIVLAGMMRHVELERRSKARPSS